jgi:hypothetical protein
MAFIRVYGRATPDRAGARPHHGGKSVPGVPLRSTPGFGPVAPSGLPKFSRSNPREIDRDLCLEQLFGIVHLLAISDRFRY